VKGFVFVSQVLRLIFKVVEETVVGRLFKFVLFLSFEIKRIKVAALRQDCDEVDFGQVRRLTCYINDRIC